MNEETVVKALQTEGGKQLIQEIIEDAGLLSETPAGWDATHAQQSFALGTQVVAKRLQQLIININTPQPNEDE